MTTSNTTAVATLEQLIENGAFASQMETYLDRTFRDGSRETWYAKTRNTAGRDAAERELAEWVERRHYNVFSSSIESVARGIVALANAQGKSLVDITDCTTNVYTAISDQCGPRSKFIVMNSSAPGCGCMQPKGSYTWGPYGEIGLRAVILETGYTHEGPTSTMTLVLPAWATNEQTIGAGTVFFAKIEANGYSQGDRFKLSIQADGKDEEVTDADRCLRYLLGMARPNGKAWTSSLTSSIDQSIGFPGAENYLAAKLTELGDYFAALAEKLSSSHTH